MTTNSYPYQQYAAKPTRSMAIKAMCADCAGGPNCDADVREGLFDSGWKATIRDCPITFCPLHKFRPYQRK